MSIHVVVLQKIATSNRTSKPAEWFPIILFTALQHLSLRRVPNCKFLHQRSIAFCLGYICPISYERLNTVSLLHLSNFDTKSFIPRFVTSDPCGTWMTRIEPTNCYPISTSHVLLQYADQEKSWYWTSCKYQYFISTINRREIFKPVMSALHSKWHFECSSVAQHILDSCTAHPVLWFFDYPHSGFPFQLRFSLS